VRQAHAVTFVRLTEPVRSQTLAAGYERLLASFDADRSNVQTALHWAETTGQRDLGLQLSTNFGSYWLFRGNCQEGRRWIEGFLAGAGGDPVLRAAGLARAGLLATFQADFDAADRYLQEGLRLAHESRAPWIASWSMLGLGVLAVRRGDSGRAIIHLDQAIIRFTAMEDLDITGPPLLSEALKYRGQAALLQGDLALAAELIDRVVTLFRERVSSWGLADALRVSGDVARAEGDLAQAAERYRECLALFERHGDRRLLAEAVTRVADLAMAQGDPAHAVRLFGAASRLATQIGITRAVVPGAALEQARAELPPPAFAAAWEAGLALSPQDVLAAALRPAPALAPPAPALASAQVGLTRREQQVLPLLAQGLSDREIAVALSISERTVGNHVVGILDKLQVNSRTAAAVEALRRGLVSLHPPGSA
ncbi:MAG: LuxR C-terminal-related transcriptional regulator, partial [Thermomicrobiales bacterium]